MTKELNAASVDALIEGSSLGTAGAKALRRRSSEAEVAETLSAAFERGPESYRDAVGGRSAAEWHLSSAGNQLKRYELLIVLDPHLDPTEITASLTTLVDLIRDSGGKAEALEPWGDPGTSTRSPQRGGLFVRLDMLANPSTLQEVRRRLHASSADVWTSLR